jgi:hypothetical protein
MSKNSPQWVTQSAGVTPYEAKVTISNISSPSYVDIYIYIYIYIYIIRGLING